METDTTVYFEQEKSRIVEMWKTLIRFKSISPDPAYAKECAACAEWIKVYLERLGFVVSLIASSGNPIILAERRGAPDKKKFVIYNHYDVQPAAIEDGWHSDPFEPVQKGERIFGRGAADNKGQLTYVLSAVEYLVGQNFDHPITLLVEGDEEKGSAALLQKLPELRQRISGDVFIVADLGCLSLDNPLVTCGVRGLLSADITIEGAPKDLHSGVHGGFAPNPAMILAGMIANLDDEFGLPRSSELLQGMELVDEATRTTIRKIPFNRDWYEGKVGVLPLPAPPELTSWERVALYPSIELLGFVSGYNGVGVKNIIPSKASAKVGLRVGPSQDVRKIAAAFEAHIRAQDLKGCKLTFLLHDMAPGGLVSPALPAVQVAKKVLDDLSGGKAGFHWEGATIPLVGPLKEACGIDPVMIGFGIEEDNIHGNDESFSIRQVQYGFNFMVKYLQSFK